MKQYEKKAVEYLRDIKDGKTNTALFNAGEAYSSAVISLLKSTGVMGNSIVATSKLPEVAAEYMIGQMGGAAGDGRDIIFGYYKNGKPYNRCLGNGFAISLTLDDYHKLIDKDELIDVNIDVIKGVLPNKVIEEVTFAMDIAGEMTRVSPMVLPRLDRDYGDMPLQKRLQYQRIFGLDDKNYNTYKRLLDELHSPLPIITEHMIRYYGLLIREIAISSDRQKGYTEKFSVPTNDTYKGYVEDLVSPSKLAKRDARMDNTRKRLNFISNEVANSASSILNNGFYYSDNILVIILNLKIHDNTINNRTSYCKKFLNS
jgi:hypothetical protein